MSALAVAILPVALSQRWGNPNGIGQPAINVASPGKVVYSIMCGRYGRRGDKQKIAGAFHIAASLQDVFVEDTEDAASGCIQPVVYLNNVGQRYLADMRWDSTGPRPCAIQYAVRGCD
jgi:hypothetical protein